MKALIVEDNKGFQKRITQLCEKRGISYDIVKNPYDMAQKLGFKLTVSYNAYPYQGISIQSIEPHLPSNRYDFIFLDNYLDGWNEDTKKAFKNNVVNSDAYYFIQDEKEVYFQSGIGTGRAMLHALSKAAQNADIESVQKVMPPILGMSGSIGAFAGFEDMLACDVLKGDKENPGWEQQLEEHFDGLIKQKKTGGPVNIISHSTVTPPVLPHGTRRE